MDCTGCVLIGKMTECQEEICGVHTTWYAIEQKKRIDELETILSDTLDKVMKIAKDHLGA